MKTQEQTNLTTYSDRITNTLYSTKVTAIGGRHGQIRSEDGLLDMKLALPRQLGGKGDATNPETLFAGGYATAKFLDPLLPERLDHLVGALVCLALTGMAITFSIVDALGLFRL